MNCGVANCERPAHVIVQVTIGDKWLPELTVCRDCCGAIFRGIQDGVNKGTAGWKMRRIKDLEDEAEYLEAGHP